MKNEAEFNQLRNDLYWTWYHSTYQGSEHHFNKLSWVGYDDDYWWNSIATQAGKNIRVCSCGKQFKLDYQTNYVSEVNPTTQAD